MLFDRSRHGCPSTSIRHSECPLICRVSALCEMIQYVSALVFRNVHVSTTVLDESAPFAPRCCRPSQRGGGNDGRLVSMLAFGFKRCAI